MRRAYLAVQIDRPLDMTRSGEHRLCDVEWYLGGIAIDDNRDVMVFDKGMVRAAYNIIKKVDLIIGYNILGFCYPVMANHIGEERMRLLDDCTLDMMPAISQCNDKFITNADGHRMAYSGDSWQKFDAVARETTGHCRKSNDPEEILGWVQEENLTKVKKLIKWDVGLMRLLYWKGKKPIGRVYYKDDFGRRVEVEQPW